MIVYLITNKINGKYYVGKTIHTAEYRWKQHQAVARWGSRTYLYNSIRKYGEESFIIEEIGSAASHSNLLDLERLWILALRSYDPTLGYNSTSGGEGNINTPETCLKKSSSRLGKKHSEETKVKIGLSKIGKPRPDSVGIAVGNAHRGKTPHNKGISPSVEVREKIRTSLIKRNQALRAIKEQGQATINK